MELEPLRHIKNSYFACVIFRRTFPQVMQEGGLWETSEQIYPYLKAVSHKGDVSWRFPSGATVAFRHMENENDRYTWLGASIPLICFDELATFTSKQFFFMLGSNRSTCGVKPYIRCTTNPEAKTWLAEFLQWWWDAETGYPIESRGGKLRYFIRYRDSIIWGDTRAELKEKYPELEPKSVTFIPARVWDNKILMEKDPGYLSNLQSLSLIDRERFLHGNWKIDVSGGIMFRKEWFKVVPERPADLPRYVRYWDLAASKPQLKNGKLSDPDYTCGCLISCKNGVWFVLDMVRMRGTPHEVEQQVYKTALGDPIGTAIRVEQEPGASGLIVVDHYARNVLAGFDFKGVPSIRNKMLRAKPASAAAEAGNVVLVQGKWNALFLDELSIFQGEDERNDQTDSFTGAFNEYGAPSTAMTFARPTPAGHYDSLTRIVSGTYRPVGM